MQSYKKKMYFIDRLLLMGKINILIKFQDAHRRNHFDQDEKASITMKDIDVVDDAINCEKHHRN